MASNIPQSGSPPPPPPPPTWGAPPPPTHWGQSASNVPVQFAGFWRRFFAYILDAIIISAASWLVIMIFGTDTFVTFPSEAEMQRAMDAGNFLAAMPQTTPASIVLGVVLTWGYYALLESSKLQATLGKMALGMRVTNAANQPISFAQATLRSSFMWAPGLLAFVDQGLQVTIAVLAAISYVSVAFSARKQGLHDRIAGTFVVR